MLEQGWSSLPPSRLCCAPAHPLHTLPHFRAVTTSTSHSVASTPSPWSRIPRWGKSQRSWAAQHRAINQPWGCCPNPVPGCPCYGAGTTGPSGLLDFSCLSSERWIWTWSPDAAGPLPVQGTWDGGFGQGLGIAAGGQQERFGHLTARWCTGDAGASAVARRE